MATVTTIPAISIEYLHVPVNASVTLDEQTVEITALTGQGTVPDASTTWTTAEWTGDAGESRTARILIGPDADLELAAGSYTVWCRVHDDPEVPVRAAGPLKLT
ncbi:MAG: hypothetical protein ACRDMV_03840 [Streptosporangiales bacterium]